MKFLRNIKDCLIIDIIIIEDIRKIYKLNQ